MDPPSLTLTPSKTVVNEGSNLILTCKADGAGVSKFEWSLADTNKPLYDSTEGVRITTFSNGHQLQQLTLKNLKLHDSRFYRYCFLKPICEPCNTAILQNCFGLHIRSCKDLVKFGLAYGS